MGGFLKLPQEGPFPYSLRQRGRRKLLIRSDWEGEDLLEILFCEMEQLEGNSACELIPTSKGSLVFKIKGTKGDLYLKYFQGQGWKGRLKVLLRGTRAQRSWRGGSLLRRSGFTTPSLIGLGMSSSFFSPPLDFLLTEAVRGLRLKQLLKDGFEKWLAERGWGKGAFLKMLALTVAELHRRGMYHGDLNPTNILVNPEGDLGLSTFCFLDNARCRRIRRVPYALRVRDLSGLNNPRLPSISVRDRLRFFAIYEKHLGAHDPGEMMEEIWQRSIRPRKRHRQGP